MYVFQAAKIACETILARMAPIKNTLPQNSPWPVLTQKSYDAGIELTAKHEFTANDAQPYNLYCCACAEVELDLLTGNSLISRVDIMEDTGESISPLVDVGQVEGAFIMGLGYWLTEKLAYNTETGELLTNRTWNYKPPGVKDIPIDFRVSFPKNNPNTEGGVLRSKSTGEPALCMAIVVPFALRHALVSARGDNGINDEWFAMGSALTPEVLFTLARTNFEHFSL